MKWTFFPRAVDFNALFLEQNATMREAAALLHAICADYTDLPAKSRRLNQLETEADTISRTISTRLSMTFITPIDREDIHDLNRAQEDMVNLLKAAGARIALYGFGAVHDPAIELADNLTKMLALTGEQWTLFLGKKSDAALFQRVEDLETESDMLLMVAMGELYERGAATPDEVLELVKWSHVYDRFEQAFGQASRLANILEGVSLKYA